VDGSSIVEASKAIKMPASDGFRIDGLAKSPSAAWRFSFGKGAGGCTLPPFQFLRAPHLKLFRKSSGFAALTFSPRTREAKSFGHFGPGGEEIFSCGNEDPFEKETLRIESARPRRKIFHQIRFYVLF
jgi:hypothetical protein